MTTEKPVYYADITAKYKDSSTRIRFSDFKSKKKGSTGSQLFTGTWMIWLQVEYDTVIQRLFDSGKIHEMVSNNRRLYNDTEGRTGFSKTDALRVYKVIITKLSGYQLLREFKSFDNFSRKELGLGDLE